MKAEITKLNLDQVQDINLVGGHTIEATLRYEAEQLVIECAKDGMRDRLALTTRLTSDQEIEMETIRFTGGFLVHFWKGLERFAVVRVTF